MTTDDWLEDPFADSEDPRAAARAERRREREARRNQQRRNELEAEEATAPPSPPPPPPPEPEREFWDDDPEPAAGERGGPAPAPGERREPPSKEPSGGRERGGRPPPSGGRALDALRRHPLRIVAVLAAIAVAWFLVALFQPFHGDGSGRVVVTIPKGAGAGEVGDILDENGVVSSSTLFQLRVTLAGKRSDLYAGRFALADGMSYGAAIDAVSQPPAREVATVTIPEGYSRAQAAPLVEEAGLSGNYLKASVRSKYLSPARYGGKGAKNLEGFLFPDTFELKPGAPASGLVQLQLEDFKRRIKGVNMSYARSKNLTVYDVLTIASMIEREAMVARERPLVAAVVYNRLHEGIPLGIDATTRFATGNYDGPLTESELASDSPYNTRNHAGLPPGPIDSPGLASIEAAARPAKVDYLYYVVKPGTCGRHAFSSTEARFEADVGRYEEARAAAGGESPDTCG